MHRSRHLLWSARLCPESLAVARAGMAGPRIWIFRSPYSSSTPLRASAVAFRRAEQVARTGPDRPCLTVRCNGSATFRFARTIDQPRSAQAPCGGQAGRSPCALLTTACIAMYSSHAGSFTRCIRCGNFPKGGATRKSEGRKATPQASMSGTGKMGGSQGSRRCHTHCRNKFAHLLSGAGQAARGPY